MDRNHNEDSNQPKVEIRNVTIFHEAFEVEPPPIDLHSIFKSLQEWLFNLCDKERPLVPITIYYFGVFESAGDYTLYVVGLNDYKIEEYRSATKIDFEPSDMYFPLPKSEFGDLDWYQVMGKVEAQLKDFIKSDKFKVSFFPWAKVIKTAAGSTIWSN